MARLMQLAHVNERGELCSAKVRAGHACAEAIPISKGRVIS